MKATGIIRRIDDLGRIVIPKEVRRTLKIKEGDPLELFLDGQTVCFTKYDPCQNIKGELSKLKEFICDECESEEMKQSLIHQVKKMEEILNERGENND